MKKRGKILRDTSTGSGLLSIEGQQYPFNLEGVWKSDVAPKVDMVVDVELGEDNQISAIHAVADTQLAKEQAQQAASALQEKGKQIASGMLTRFGMSTLLGMAALIAGWFFLNTVAIQVSSDFKIGISFWKILALVNSPQGFMNAIESNRGSAGMYGFFAFLALIAPLASYVWKDPRAHLGGVFPLLFMLFVCAMIYWGISDSVKQVQGAASMFGGGERAAEMAADMASGMIKEAMRAMSVGVGAYISLIASVYFAGKGITKFLAAKA